MSNPIGTMVQLKALGLVPLGEGNGHATTMARDEGRHGAFLIRVKVPHGEDRPTLRINGVRSDASDIVEAVRNFLQVVRS